MANLKCSLTYLQPMLQPIFFKNQWITLNLWVSSLKCSLCLSGLLTESLSYNTHYGCSTLSGDYLFKLYLKDHWLCTTLMGVQPLVQPNLVTTTYRITGLHYIYGCPTLSAAYVGWLYFQNQCVTLHLWCSRCLFGLLKESLSYNTLIGVPP